MRMAPSAEEVPPDTESSVKERAATGMCTRGDMAAPSVSCATRRKGAASAEFHLRTARRNPSTSMRRAAFQEGVIDKNSGTIPTASASGPGRAVRILHESRTIAIVVNVRYHLCHGCRPTPVLSHTVPGSQSTDRGFALNTGNSNIARRKEEVPPLPNEPSAARGENFQTSTCPDPRIGSASAGNWRLMCITPLTRSFTNL
jgi:hypothetical protein